MSRLLAAVLVLAVCLGALTACRPSASETGAGASPSADAASSAVPMDDDTAAALPDSLLVPPSDSTRARFDSVMTAAERQNLADRPLGEIIADVGAMFEAAPYLAGTLDEPPTETLVVRFDGFDCVTFVETALALGRGIAQGDTSYAGFARRLADLRYGGRTIGYCQRLHYFTDWMETNRRNGWLRTDLGIGTRRTLRDTLRFMGEHRSAYPRFATNDSLFQCIRGMEDRLLARGEDVVRYVPQDSIRAVYPHLKSGDVIALITSIDGLHVTHTGLAVERSDGTVGLLHASTSGGVMVSPDIQRYVRQIDHQIGIVVARPQEET
jgi:hypothetical protein